MIKTYSKIVIPLMVAILLMSCSSEVKPLEVTYQVIPMDEISKTIEDSSISRQYSDYHTMELASIFGSYSSTCIFDYIILYDVNTPDNYIQDTIKYIFRDQIDTTRSLKITSSTSDSIILEQLSTSTSIQFEESSVVIPVLPELITLAQTAEYKDAFVKSLRELA